MKKVKITFDNIVQLRKFESSLSFLGFEYQINDELMEIEINPDAIRQQYKVEITSGSVAVTFKTEEK